MSATYLGIDLATRPDRTGVCELAVRDDDRAAVRVLHPCTRHVRCRNPGHPDDCLTDDGSDAELCERIATADKTGIDVPFGWPRAFVDAVTHHHRGTGWRVVDLTCAHTGRCSGHDSGDACKRDLRWRTTDLVASSRLGWDLLSVSSDRLGGTALRMANIEHRLSIDHGVTVDRTGCEGQVVEVYPAGAMALWLGPAAPNKQSKKAMRTAFTTSIEALDLDWWGDSMKRVLEDRADHDFDALISALVAWMAAEGQTLRPAGDEITAATAEGWIHLPAPDSSHPLAAALERAE